jgi:phospholipase/carboxylesterase
MRLTTVEVETGPAPTGTVIWLHGLGADGHDFEPAVPALTPPGLTLRFVLPHAPVRPVTLNGGYPMRAWYDIVALDRRAPSDVAGTRQSAADVTALIARENERGIPTERIVLAGFSQGGALALFTGTRLPQKLAGIIGLSCYMPAAADFAAEAAAANRSTRIFLAHGLYDAVVAPDLGQWTRQLLQTAGYDVDWHTYPMEHSLCAEEVAAVAEFLARCFSLRPVGAESYT